MNKRIPLLRPRKKQNKAETSSSSFTSNTSNTSKQLSAPTSITTIRHAKKSKRVHVVWLAAFICLMLGSYAHLVTKYANKDAVEMTDMVASSTPQTAFGNKTYHEGIEYDQSDVHLSKDEDKHHASNNRNQDEDKHHASNNPKFHLIFSTGCTTFQNWQSYLLFHSALKVNQPGTITRIASGCSDEDAEKKWHKEHISDVMGERFKLHLTPHFSKIKDKDGKVVGDYKFFNKPFGLLHWLEHGNISDGDEYENVLDHPDDIVILIDPDMILMKPITDDFSNKDDVIVGPRHRKEQKFFVKKGSPFAQKYGLGEQWRKFDLDKIAGPDSPAKDVSQSDGGAFYPAGPPYLATTSDMYQIALKWAEFAPLVHAQYPHLLAEMYAFCIAAAHLGLKHQLVDSLMISNVRFVDGGEGWPMIDKITTDKVDSLCQYSSQSDHSEFPVPSTIHYCHRYAIGDWFFGKHRMNHKFFECDSPLMEFPPLDIIETTKYQQFWDGERNELSDTRMARREGFMVCGIIGALNDAALYFKENSCKEVESNLEKKININHLEESEVEVLRLANERGTQRFDEK